MPFAKAEALGFTEPSLYYQRGETFHALGRFEEAFRDYSVALTQAPSPTPAAEFARMRRAEAAVNTREV